MHELKVESIHKSYRGGGEPLHVLRDLSLTLSRGDSLAVVGPSGSGKSTLLQILGTLDRPDSGKVEIAGTDPFVLDERELAEFRNAKFRDALVCGDGGARVDRRRDRRLRRVRLAGSKQSDAEDCPNDESIQGSHRDEPCKHAHDEPPRVVASTVSECSKLCGFISTGLRRLRPADSFVSAVG